MAVAPQQRGAKTGNAARLSRRLQTLILRKEIKSSKKLFRDGQTTDFLLSESVRDSAYYFYKVL